MLKRWIFVLLVTPIAAQANAFSLTDTDGKIHTLAGHQGKWVLVNLWATWCGPCLAEMPELQALKVSRADLVILGVAIDGQDVGHVLEYARKMAVTYPIIAGNRKLARQFGARGYPTSILYDRSGKQVFFKEGAVKRVDIEKEMR